MSETPDIAPGVMAHPETDARRVLRLRRAKGWSQRQMGEFLGVAQSSVAGYEAGLPPLGPVRRLLDILDSDTPDSPTPPAACEPAADTAAGGASASPAAFSGDAA